MNKNQKAGIIITIIGICLIVLGVILYAKQMQLINKSDPITATIVKIKSSSQERNEQGQMNTNYKRKGYSTYVNFSWNGYEYNNQRIEYYQSDWKAGDKIQLYGYYDGETLTILSAQGNKTSLIAFSCFGLLCLAIGVPVLISGIRKKRLDDQ